MTHPPSVEMSLVRVYRHAAATRGAALTLSARLLAAQACLDLTSAAGRAMHHRLEVARQRLHAPGALDFGPSQGAAELQRLAGLSAGSIALAEAALAAAAKRQVRHGA